LIFSDRHQLIAAIIFCIVAPIVLIYSDLPTTFTQIESPSIWNFGLNRLASTWFDLAYLITRSSELTIILSAFCIQASILPLTVICEKYKRHLSILKKKVKLEDEKIDQNFSGEEAYWKKYSLRKQAGILSLEISSSAASIAELVYLLYGYKLLMELDIFYPNYFFNDLNRSDRLLHLSNNWSINLLPLLWCVFILYLFKDYIFKRTVQIYKKVLFLSVIACLLGLLYDIKSAIMIFWTATLLIKIVIRGLSVRCQTSE